VRPGDEREAGVSLQIKDQAAVAEELKNIAADTARRRRRS